MTAPRRPSGYPRNEGRRATPADWGFSVAIAIAAVSHVEDIFVCVSDRMVSFDDISPASDNVTHKMFGLHNDWVALFAGNDINAAWPLLLAVRDRMSDGKYDLDAVQNFFSEAYTDAIQRKFLDHRLRKLGYESMNQFRKEGRVDLDARFYELERELSKSEIGAQFIVCGFDSNSSPRLVEIDNPGHAVSREILRYAVIGSGYHMAMAALRRKPLVMTSLPATVYRLLEAKFSSETATGVGKKTTAFLKGRTGARPIEEETIEKVRRIWERLNIRPEPSEAIKLIETDLARK